MHGEAMKNNHRSNTRNREPSVDLKGSAVLSENQLHKHKEGMKRGQKEKRAEEE